MVASPPVKRVVASWVCVACVAGCSGAGDGDATQGDGGGRAQPDASDASDASKPSQPCPSGVVDGDYVVETDDDAAAIAGCTEITGDLSVTGDVETVDLSSLTMVGGSFRIHDTTALDGIELPALLAVSRDLEVNANAALATFAAPALESTNVTGFFDNDALTDVDISALADTGFIRLQKNAALPSFSAPLVDELGVFFVSENSALVSASFDSLTTITIDGFILTKNAVVTTLDLPVLTNVFGDVLISMNPMFPACRAEEIRAQIDDPSVPFVAEHNDDSATCP